MNKNVIALTLKHTMKFWYVYIPALFIYSTQNILIVAYTSFVQYTAVDMIEMGNVHMLGRTILVSISIYIVLLIILGLGVSLFDYASIKISNSVKKFITANILDQGWDYKNPLLAKDEVLARIIDDSSRMVSFMTHILGSILMPIITTFGGIVALHVISWRLSWIAIAYTIAVLIYSLLFRKRFKRIVDSLQKSQASYIRKVANILNGILTIKAMNMEQKQTQGANEDIAAIKCFNIRHSYMEAFKDLFSCTINIISLLASLVAAFELYRSGTISLAAFTIVPLFLGNIFLGVRGISSSIWESQFSFVSMSRVYEVIEASNDARAIRDSEYSEIDNKIKGNMSGIIARNLACLYENNRGLHPISFIIKEGDIVLIKGAIGTGKSTLVKTLMGLIHKTEGSISFNEINQNSCSTLDWLKHFAYVEQTPNLFGATVRENIVMEHDYDNNRLEEALKITGFSQCINKLQNGLDTKIGGNTGISLSGGEAQLLCLTRALYSKAPIMIWDEFSSAMDEQVVTNIKQVLKQIKESRVGSDKTIVIVSHDQSYIEVSDAVISLDREEPNYEL